MPVSLYPPMDFSNVERGTGVDERVEIDRERSGDAEHDRPRLAIVPVVRCDTKLRDLIVEQFDRNLVAIALTRRLEIAFPLPIELTELRQPSAERGDVFRREADANHAASGAPEIVAAIEAGKIFRTNPSTSSSR